MFRLSIYMVYPILKPDIIFLERLLYTFSLTFRKYESLVVHYLQKFKFIFR